MNGDRNLILGDNQNNQESVENKVEEQVVETPEVQNNQKQMSGLAIVGLILAFLLPPLGLIVSLMAKKDVANNKEDGKTFALIGIIVGTLGTLSLLAVLIISMFFKKAVLPEVQNNIILNTACSNLDKNGSYSNEYVKCKDYVCTYTNEKGKKQTQNCSSRYNYDNTKNVEPEGELTEDELDELIDWGS